MPDLAAAGLKPRGGERKPSQTRLPHTRVVPAGTLGLDFLGLHLRQYPAGQPQSGQDCRGRLPGFKPGITPSKAALPSQVHALHAIVPRPRQAEQRTLSQRLNPVLSGWPQYYAHGTRARVFAKVPPVLSALLCAGAGYRQPPKNTRWTTSHYWRGDAGQGWVFPPPHHSLGWSPHYRPPLRRQGKVQGSRRPYDGDWGEWRVRLGRHPAVSSRIARLLKRPQGKCPACGLFFTAGDRREVDPLIPPARGGSDALTNLQLLPQHCHERKTASDSRRPGPCDKRQVVEEPDEAKASRPVLEPRRHGAIPA